MKSSISQVTFSVLVIASKEEGFIDVETITSCKEQQCSVAYSVLASLSEVCVERFWRGLYYREKRDEQGNTSNAAVLQRFRVLTSRNAFPSCLLTSTKLNTPDILVRKQSTPLAITKITEHRPRSLEEYPPNSNYLFYL